jgi:IMP dehydrogenase/GMP reductase
MAFDYEHINLVPKKCVVGSRSECDTSVTLGKFTFKMPVVPANMECVINQELAEKLASNHYFYILHRFLTDEQIIEFCKNMKTKSLFSSISVGVNEPSYTLLKNLKELSLVPDFITIDIAHGHSVKMELMIKFIYDLFGAERPFIIAGNISTPEAVVELESWGADACKLGIGPGCFKGNTKILLANGSYKNIEDMEIGDIVINKDGNAVKVKNVMNKGIRPVVKIKNNLHYEYTYVTDDHKFFIGDLSTSSDKSVSSSGIAKLLDKKAKTKPKTSKYKWKELKECDWKKTFCLLPKNINWQLPEDFVIDLLEYTNRGEYDDSVIYTVGCSSGEKTSFNRFMKSSYELGYLFGTYLGDGCANIRIDSKTKCESGQTKWFFGAHETKISDKLIKCIKTLLNIDIGYKKTDNMNIITLYNKSLSKVLNEFGKKINKNLPTKYYCKNKEYIEGLFDGLIDSDGYIKEKSIVKEDTYIFAFNNTSKKLIELFEWCCMNLHISFTSSLHSEGDAGGLKDIKDTTVFNPSWHVQTHTLNRYTKDYLYSNVLDFDYSEPELCETWDIEVDCDTHSFIANNMIVHNSACTTYPATGFGSRGIQAFCIEQCAKVATKPLIADGGIRHPGDITKSIVLGASMCMIGGMFSALKDSPGNMVMGTDGRVYKEFWGSASEHQSGKSSRIEGFKKLNLMQEKTMLEEMKYLEECLQSSISYGGGTHLHHLKSVSYIQHV